MTWGKMCIVALTEEPSYIFGSFEVLILLFDFAISDNDIKAE